MDLNLVSFFKLMNEMMGRRLQVHVGTTGGAESLLHYGSKRSSGIEAEFRFTAEQRQYRYALRLVPAAGNSLIFGKERLEFPREGTEKPGGSEGFGGHQESELAVIDDFADPSWKLIGGYLARCRVFHFHDTSFLGPMRRDCPVDANRSLYPDAANLPAMLYLYRERYPTAYHRIVAAVKAVAPFFEDFVLEPLRLNPRNIALNWRAKGSEYDFGAHQLSDGTLRAIA